MKEKLMSRRDFIRLAGGLPMLHLEGKVRRFSEYLSSVTLPPIIFTGFEPFIDGEDWNSSTTIVKYLQTQFQNLEKPQMYFLPNLPANTANPGIAARQIEDLARKNCQEGCIIMSLGEDKNLSKGNTVARIEGQSRASPDVPEDFPIQDLPIWQLSNTFCRRIGEYIENNHQNIFGTNSNLTVQLPLAIDTAGSVVCEKTLTSLNSYSWDQARVSNPCPILPIFIHVPDFDNIQTLLPTISVIVAVAQEATQYFKEYSDHPETFIAKIVPQYNDF